MTQPELDKLTQLMEQIVSDQIKPNTRDTRLGGAVNGTHLSLFILVAVMAWNWASNVDRRLGQIEQALGIKAQAPAPRMPAAPASFHDRFSAAIHKSGG